MTDSEILAGIDGLFMSQKISKLSKNGNRLKLSQVLDMFYSKRGLPFLLVESADNDNDDINDSFQTSIEANQMDLKSKQNLYTTNDPISFNTQSYNNFRVIFDHPEIEWHENHKNSEQKILSRFSTRDGITNACHRMKIIRILNHKKLKEETLQIAQVIQLSTSSFTIDDVVLRRNCDATVDRFFRYSGNTTK